MRGNRRSKRKNDSKYKILGRKKDQVFDVNGMVCLYSLIEVL